MPYIPDHRFTTPDADLNTLLDLTYHSTASGPTASVGDILAWGVAVDRVLMRLGHDSQVKNVRELHKRLGAPPPPASRPSAFVPALIPTTPQQEAWAQTIYLGWFPDRAPSGWNEPSFYNLKHLARLRAVKELS